MTKTYIAKEYLSKKGEIIKPESEIKLTDAQAERLGNKVVLVEDHVEKPNDLNELTNKDLKKIAKNEGLEGYDKLNKAELIALIEGAEQE